MRIPVSIIAVMALPFLRFGDSPAYQDIETAFPLHWKARMGSASFRTNVLFTDDQLYIGSNGERFKDYLLLDNRSGVYRIDRKNGKVIDHFAGELLGDMDVNGLLRYNNRLYFGNDNEEFLCTTPEGKMLWRIPASGDIEHEPVLIGDRGKKYIVYATELGEVRAIDPASGATHWQYFTPEFSGWKPGENRQLFKVNAYFSGSRSFFVKPAVADLNGDGADDLVYLGYDDRMYAISGTTGKALWTYKSETPFGFALAIRQGKDGPEIMTLTSVYRDEGYAINNRLLCLDRKGNPVTRTELRSAGYGNALNAMVTAGKEVVLSTLDSLLVIAPDGTRRTIGRADWYITEYAGKPDTVLRNCSEPILSGATFRMPGEGRCLAVLNQSDYASSSGAYVEIVSLDKGHVVSRLSLPARSEMPPVVADVNKDGRLDLLVNCFDGYLYCYDLKTKD